MPRKTMQAMLCTVALLLLALTVSAQTTQRGKTMHATGTFDVTVKPAEASAIGKEAGLGRFTIDKTWSGGIEGTSKGEMTTSGVGKLMLYVALETMTVRVDGRSGTFVFWHRATMSPDHPSSTMMEVAVVPGSGTGDLNGILGKLAITIGPSGHSYDFEYTLPVR